MPSSLGQSTAAPRKGKIIQSAFDSESFDADGTIHVDGLVGSATISPSGRDVALASPEGLAIIDLDSPYSPPRRLGSHGLPWLVVDVQWSPFAARDYWVASTANHRCLVWNLNLRDDSSSGAIEHSLQGHSRAITDINFSAHHPDLLATCSVDGYVHCWDLRRPKQPALTFCDWFAGATQVKYNRQDPHILASAHDRWLHIWDDRKSSEPLKSISAHTSKIYGVDWNRFRTSGIVTCSLDKSIKFWDYENHSNVPERVIRTDFPVWRARHTPFGWGLLAMPQNEPGNLYMYDRRWPPDTPVDGPVEPLTVFSGHGNHKVKEFLWRSRGGVSDDGIDNREFQLVSWGEDNQLRLQTVDTELFEAVGYFRGTPASRTIKLTRKGANYKTFRTVDDGGSQNRRSSRMSDARLGNGVTQFQRSALTMSMQAPHEKASPSWKGPSMKAKTAAGKGLDKSQAHIGWMRGISMNKRKTSSDVPLRKASKDSSLFNLGYHEGEWAEPETIQEEFIRISNQLPNVKWENIDMDNLSLRASLKGPWGVDGDTIFIKVKVDIPSSYPKSKAPAFYVEKTSFMPEKSHNKIERELHELTHQFLKRKQNCLDVAFSYLLGEVDLESSTSFFKNVGDLDDGIDVLADDSSSDEDDNDIPTGGSAAMSQELPTSVEIENTLAPTHRNTIPPVPRTCGARFSNNGFLVCFFPTREEKAKAMLFAPMDPSKERPKGEPNFAGFGRLTASSPPLRQKHMNDDASATDDHSDASDESDDSSSSSDSELTTMHRISLWYQPSRRFKKTWSANDSVRSSGGGTGAGTGTGTGISSKRRTGRPKNIISIHDLRADLPSKHQFAQEYAIFGDGAAVCNHNATVAAKYGYQDLVDIWKYSAFLLRSDIPLELHDERMREKPILVIAKDVVARAMGPGSPKDGSERSPALAGKVRWGYHPLARGFVHDLFNYFERLADIQMLAMLSCIFGESSAEDCMAYAGSRLPQPETPLFMKAPSFSLEYFPTDTALWDVHGRSNASSALNTPRTSHTPILYSGSQNSEDGLWDGDPGSQSYSCGETPPTRKSHLVEVDQTQSLSTSPDNRFRRNNSTITALASSLPRALAGASTSSSPPNPPSRKRPSPAETILSNFAPSNITWGSSTVFGQPADTGTARTSMSDDEYRRDEMISLIPFSVYVMRENPALFDDDGWMATPLLEPTHYTMYAHYRYAYAELLQMWGQPLARLEIMKFDVLNEDVAGDSAGYATEGAVENTHQESMRDNGKGPSHSRTNSSAAQQTHHLLGGKREQFQDLLASGRGLDVSGICRKDELQLDPLQYTQLDCHLGGAMGTCHRCHRVQSQLVCVYCHESIDAMYPPCLGCGCASHEACIAEWHAMGEILCPAGDECNCIEEASNGRVESEAAIMAAIEKLRAAERSPGAPGKGRGMPGRRGRRSAPSGLRHLTDIEYDNMAADEDDDVPRTPASSSSRRGVGTGTGPGEDDNGDMREDWESVVSSQHVPSGGPAHGGKPSPYVNNPLSAARVSLGNRLKKSAGDWSRPGAVRRDSGSLRPWTKPGT